MLQHLHSRSSQCDARAPDIELSSPVSCTARCRRHVLSCAGAGCNLQKADNAAAELHGHTTEVATPHACSF